MTENTGYLDKIKQAAQLIKSKDYVSVLTGAGISTPSGIPDFRSPESGLWERYDPFEVASLNAFRYHPENFFAWMRSLAVDLMLAEPNPAHKGLAKLEQEGCIATIITQNFDGLHQKAGSRNVLEVHGSLGTLTCINCYQQYESGGFLKPYLEEGEIPHCPNCGHVLKPDVVLFGEQLPVRVWLRAQEAARSSDLLIVAGSSLEVLPVAGLPMVAVDKGASLIIINQSKTYIDERADIIIYKDVAEVIPSITQEVLGDRYDP